ncbi:MAG TPA: VIT1/CCC1 transporter family protein [Candidatus Saccharimonadales bacterium]|nr:VIT1/CCC1 transporter family protein [Candidatus Saccharimonadales bacterium]
MPRHYRFKEIPLGADNFLSVLEGVEGGFAIFAGIVAGLSFEHVSRELLILTAAIGIIVNAFNSSAMRYTSEHFMDELDGHEKRRWYRAYLWPALIEFLVYGLVSLVAILPLVLIGDQAQAVGAMIVITLLFLFSAGWARGQVTYHHRWRDGLEILLSGGLIVVVGGLAGWGLSQLIG